MLMAATLLLWLGAAVLYDATWLRRADVDGTGLRRALWWIGYAFTLAGHALSAVAAPGWGAGLCGALAHFTAALTTLALLSPLVQRPRWVLAGVAVCGALLGVLEASR